MHMFLLLLVPCLCLELIQVQVMTRHGDRVPAYDINSAPLRNSYVWNDCLDELSLFSIPSPREFSKVYSQTALPGNCHLGQLTKLGIQQLQNLGQKFRNQYIETTSLLGPALNNSELRIESTDVHRTLMSAKSLVMGLYPKGAEMVPIFTQDAEISNMFPNPKICPMLNKLLSRIQESDNWKHKEEELRPFKEEMARILQMKVEQLPSWISLYDAFICRRSHQVPLIPEMTEEKVDKLISIAEWQWSTYLNESITESKLYSQLSMYTILQVIKNRIKQVIANDPNAYKFILYSGHDTSIAAMLATLSSYDNKWPPYASHIVIELYKADVNYFVKASYNDKVLQLPGCESEMCPFEIFNSIPNLSEEEYHQHCVQ